MYGLPTEIGLDDVIAAHQELLDLEVSQQLLGGGCGAAGGNFVRLGAQVLIVVQLEALRRLQRRADRAQAVGRGATGGAPSHVRCSAGFAGH